jgi:hypothetical protein
MFQFLYIYGLDILLIRPTTYLQNHHKKNSYPTFEIKRGNVVYDDLEKQKRNLESVYNMFLYYSFLNARSKKVI